MQRQYQSWQQIALAPSPEHSAFCRMPITTQRLNRLPPYPLAHIPQRKRELLARGVDVIDLGAGDADLPPPTAAVEALARAAHDPTLGRYGFGLGYVPFRQAISDWMQRRFGQHFDPLTEMMPLIGSKEGIAHIAFGFLQAGGCRHRAGAGLHGVRRRNIALGGAGLSVCAAPAHQFPR